MIVTRIDDTIDVDPSKSAIVSGSVADSINGFVARINVFAVIVEPVIVDADENVFAVMVDP